MTKFTESEVDRLKTKGKNRIMSLLLSVMLSIEQFAMAMPLISTAATSAQNSDSVPFPEVGNNVTDAESAKLNHDDNLVDNGDGTFTFTSKISADYSFSDISESRLKSTDGYYDLDKEGTYLIELWGGDGGDGGRGFLTGRSGVGGSGGWVYGTLEVSEANGNLGKKLAYEIGSKGESQTYDITGGGTAGDGGGAGELAFVSVGAGGGYSAVYLLDKEPPVEENLSPDPETAPSPPDLSNLRDNPKKVIMIAGGGGGGAAGANGFHLTALVLKMHADGGDGGSPESSIKATPDIGSFNTGTYYAGYNGTSSGGKTSYVGQGGTDRPEGIAKTTLGGMQASTYANDWQRIYHTELKRGVGGAGNLHGGGGGAGFAGGGGGIQNVIIDANNVGGGGGGSSYIASGYDAGTDTGIRGFQPLGRPANDDYFVQQGENDNKEIGGAIVIRYLPPDAHYDYLNDVTISGTVSNYFDIVPEGTKCVNNVDGTDIPLESTPDPQNRKFTITGNTVEFRGSVAPVPRGLRKGQAQNTLTLTLKLKPKTDFMGGNDVPIFNYTSHNAFSCTSGEGANQKQCAFMTDDTSSEKYADDYRVSHVNVPFKHEIKTNSIVRKVEESYSASDLLPAQTLTGNEFITLPIIQPTLSDFTPNMPIGYYTYEAKAYITPSSAGANSVGTANTDPTEIKATASVQVIEGLQVDGFSVKAEKGLSYDKDNGTYDFDVDMKVSLNGINAKTLYSYEAIPSTTVTYENKSSTTYTTAITLDEPGIYYVEIWGGDGGKGGDKQYKLFSPGTASGGTGGKGGFNSCYITVEEDEEKSLFAEIGYKGANGTSNSTFSSVTNGSGGTATKLWINTTDHSDSAASLIAGGGGGGGKPLTYGSKDQNYHMGYYGLDGDGVEFERIITNINNVSDPDKYYDYPPEEPVPHATGYNGENANNIVNEDFVNNQSSVLANFAKGGRNETKPGVITSLSEILNSTEIERIDGNVEGTSITAQKGTSITYVGAVSSNSSVFAQWAGDRDYYLEFPGEQTGSSTTSWEEYPFTLNAIYNNTTKNATELQNQTGGAIKITRLGIKPCINDGSDKTYATNSAMSSDLAAKQAGFVEKLAGYLVSGFKVTEDFSSYFNVDTAHAPEIHDSDAGVTLSTGVANEYTFAITNTSVAKDKVALSGSGTEISYQPISGYGYYVNKTTYTYTIAETKMGVRVHLKPVDLLAGGNDVPLLNVKKVSEIGDADANTAYMNANKDSDDKPEVSIYHTGTTENTTSDDTDYIPRNNGTDWANVKINPDSFTVTADSGPIIVDYGDTVKTPPGTAGLDTEHTWITDFVNSPTVTYSPTEPFTSDGICSVVGKLEPYDAQKAVVIPPVSAVKKSAQIDVKLKYSVKKTLNNVSQESVKCLNDNKPENITGDNVTLGGSEDKFILDEIHDAYVLTIEPVTGYDLPDESEVQVYYGTDSTDKVKAADVYKKGGKLIITIPSSAFTNNITIEATGVEQTDNTKHQVHYYYEVYDPRNGINNGITYVSADGGKYNRGEAINEAKPYTPASGDYPEGYVSYCWTWPDGKADSDPHTMEDTDIYVIGRYVPETYKLVIKYCIAGSEEPFDTYISPDYTEYDPETDTYNIALTDGATYMVRSPEKAGYTPRQAYISGTVDEAFKAGLADVIIAGETFRGKEMKVYYDPAAGNLTVYKVECDKYGIPTDGNALFAESPVLNDTVNGDFNKETDITAPEGYRISKRTKLNDKNAEEIVEDVSGTLAADEKAVYYVYYIPEPQIVIVNFNKYDVNEDVKPADADIILEKTSRNAAKGMEYGYDPDSDTYVGLPRAVCKEYLFDGWYTASGQLIEEDMVIPENAEGPIELFAHWKDAHITIDVDYWYGNDIADTEKRGTSAGDSKHYDNLLYGMSYSIESYDRDGYTASEDPVTGVALKPLTRSVYYSDSSTKRILNVDIYSETNRDTENTAVPKTNANKLKEGTFVLYDSTGTNKLGTLKENEKGTVSWTSVDAGIVAGGTYIVKCEDPPPGYGAAAITVELTSYQTDEYGNSVYTAYFFLDKSPFQLPSAGGTPVTGYTVFGISTMLLAAFLLFLYVSSKSEDKNENE